MPQTLNRYVYCVNSPLIHVDPTGRFWNIVVGAVAGAVVGGVMAAATGGDIWAGVASGAIGGAITGATLGLALAATATTSGVTTLLVGGGTLALGGAASSVASDVVSNTIQGKQNDWGKIAENAAFGAITNVAFTGAGGVLSKASKIFASRTPSLISMLDPGKWQSSLEKLKPVALVDKAMDNMPAFNKMPMVTLNKHTINGPTVTKAVGLLNYKAFHQPLTASDILWGIGKGTAKTTMNKGIQALVHNWA